MSKRIYTALFWTIGLSIFLVVQATGNPLHAANSMAVEDLQPANDNKQDATELTGLTHWCSSQNQFNSTDLAGKWQMPVLSTLNLLPPEAIKNIETNYLTNSRN